MPSRHCDRAPDLRDAVIDAWKHGRRVTLTFETEGRTYDRVALIEGFDTFVITTNEDGWELHDPWLYLRRVVEVDGE